MLSKISKVVDGKKQWGFATPWRKIVIPYKYDEILSFNEGFVPVKKDNLIGFVNTRAGVEIVPCKYEAVTDFLNGYSRVRKDGLWGFINGLGE